MLRNARKLKSFELCAQDGDIGFLRDFLIDLREWNVRYFVVETNSWFRSQQVLISPEALADSPGEKEVLNLRLNKLQVQQSPAFSPLEGISRDFESRLRDHYGWQPYDGGSATPLPPSSMPDLRSQLFGLKSLTGYSIIAKDGEVGRVANALIDDASWQVRSLVVETSWLLGLHVLLFMPWIERVDQAGRRIELNVDCERIKSSPAYNPLQPFVTDFVTQLQA